MNEPDFFLFEGLDPAKFYDYYNLYPVEKECEHCGRLIFINTPFVSGNVRGLCSKVCECGKQKAPYVVSIDVAPPLSFEQYDKEFVEGRVYH